MTCPDSANVMASLQDLVQVCADFVTCSKTFEPLFLLFHHILKYPQQKRRGTAVLWGTPLSIRAAQTPSFLGPAAQSQLFFSLQEFPPVTVTSLLVLVLWSILHDNPLLAPLEYKLLEDRRYDLLLIESDKIMFHEGKDRKIEGVGRASTSLMNLNLKTSNGPKKSPLLIADTVLELWGSRLNHNQPVIRAVHTERLGGEL